MLYCHRLAKRLEAAREDFSLSGLRAVRRVRVRAREAGWSGQGTQPGCCQSGQLSPVPLLLDEDKLSEPIKVEQISGGNGTGHHQVVEYSYDIDQHLGGGRLLTHTARELLNQVTHHLGSCGEAGGSQCPPFLDILAPWVPASSGSCLLTLSILLARSQLAGQTKGVGWAGDSLTHTSHPCSWHSVTDFG